MMTRKQTFSSTSSCLKQRSRKSLKCGLFVDFAGSSFVSDVESIATSEQKPTTQIAPVLIRN